jgi:tRNA-dihydrouridine synthase B
MGVRTARKHIGWYVRALPGGEVFRQAINTLEDTTSQLRAVANYLDDLAGTMDRLPTWNVTVDGQKNTKKEEICKSLV